MNEKRSFVSEESPSTQKRVRTVSQPVNIVGSKSESSRSKRSSGHSGDSSSVEVLSDDDSKLENSIASFGPFEWSACPWQLVAVVVEVGRREDVFSAVGEVNVVSCSGWPARNLTRAWSLRARERVKILLWHLSLFLNVLCCCQWSSCRPFVDLNQSRRIFLSVIYLTFQSCLFFVSRVFH